MRLGLSCTAGLCRLTPQPLLCTGTGVPLTQMSEQKPVAAICDLTVPSPLWPGYNPRGMVRLTSHVSGCWLLTHASLNTPFYGLLWSTRGPGPGPSRFCSSSDPRCSPPVPHRRPSSPPSPGHPTDGSPVCRLENSLYCGFWAFENPEPDKVFLLDLLVSPPGKFCFL